MKIANSYDQLGKRYLNLREAIGTYPPQRVFLLLRLPFLYKKFKAINDSLINIPWLNAATSRFWRRCS